MKNLKFQSLLLLSKKEKAARRISFQPKITLILGENDTGKSSLIKSIYATFGADPAVTHSDWKSLGVALLIAFEVDGAPYKLLRSSSIFALFDGQGKKLWSVSGITSRLAPQLAELFGLNLRMQSREGELVVPPPAYFFAPFYVDQDAGWQRNWASFSSMQQFENSRQSLALFHTGVRPNEFYAAQAAKIEADRAKVELNKERDALERTAKRLRAGRKVLSFDLNPESFGDRINELIRRASALRARQDEVRIKLAALHTTRAVLVEQTEIAGASLAELDADFDFLRKSVDAEIACPTCGTIHQNDFVNKFSLIADVDTCRSFMFESRQDLERIEQEISGERQRFASFDGDIAAIEALLNETKDDLRLRDILESESERLVDNAFDSERHDIDLAVGEKDGAAEKASAIMRSFTDRKRETRIKEFFGEKLHQFALHLQVPTLPDSFFKSLYANPPETGSDQPRALLAYYYAFAHTVREFSTALTGPLVIDSPVQQDQDPANAERIMQFALDNVPSGMQLVLGSVRLHNAIYPGRRIELLDKRRLLRREEYDDVRDELEPLLNSLL
jgi:predicted  nucleic acid-binding Zn-ribbon protein